MFITIVKKFNQKEATRVYNSMLEWFNDNPKRIICRTDFGKIRRKHTKEDVLLHCIEGVKIK